MSKMDIREPLQIASTINSPVIAEGSIFKTVSKEIRLLQEAVGKVKDSFSFKQLMPINLTNLMGLLACLAKRIVGITRAVAISRVLNMQTILFITIKPASQAHTVNKISNRRAQDLTAQAVITRRDLRRHSMKSVMMDHSRKTQTTLTMQARSAQEQ